MKWIAVLLVMVGISFAQSRSSCPGEVIYVTSYRNTPDCLKHSCLSIGLLNHTEKKIVGAKFGVQYLDAVGDANESPFHYTSSDKVKPSKKNEYRWAVDSQVQDDSQGTIAWIEKLLFEDGSTWEDAGAKTCMGMGGILANKVKQGKVRLPKEYTR